MCLLPLKVNEFNEVNDNKLSAFPCQLRNPSASLIRIAWPSSGSDQPCHKYRDTISIQSSKFVIQICHLYTIYIPKTYLRSSIHPTENPVFLSLYFFSQRRNLTSTEFTLSARWCGDVGVVVDLELANSPLEGTISKGNESFYQPTNHQFSGNICESAWGITFTYHFSGDICESSWGNHISLKADVCVCV